MPKHTTVNLRAGASLTIAGVTHQAAENSRIEIDADGTTRINGETVQDAPAAGGALLQIVIHGDIESLQSAGDVDVRGDVGQVTAKGDVACEYVRGDVNATGDVEAETIAGAITAGGDVTIS